ncbi:MAG: 30S ribosomal protein S12 methylthiotransferase RimO [Chlorobi bacterium]|nr:30S ribosomal protein S12 methylthiotransferase RimO [Chlorobiota bacterium]
MKTKINKPDTVNIVTLGCSKNLVDSEILMNQIKLNNLKVVHNSNDLSAKTVIINTCGFINDAKEESINTILEFAKAKENKQIENLYVIGCLSERYKKDLELEIPNVDAYFGSNNLKEIIDTLQIDYKKDLVGERLLTTPSHYAYLKISEGCNRKCSFCAIPLMRGKHISKPIENIVKEAAFLVNNGVKEIVLIAQDLTYYGFDIYHKYKLAELLDKLAKINGLQWLRLHYVYPSDFPLEVLDVMKQHNNICKYIDIPLQHCSDNVLKKMRRGITQNQTIELIKKIRNIIPGIAIRTTLMTGHPGETEQDFKELKQFIQESRFDRLGIFPYSNEEDTYSYINYKDEIPEEEKISRMEELMEIQREISLELNNSKIGKTFKVLIDRREGANFIGRTEFDSPEVDNEVIIVSSNTSMQIGQFYKITITEANEYDLVGKLSEN